MNPAFARPVDQKLGPARSPPPPRAPWRRAMGVPNQGTPSGGMLIQVVCLGAPDEIHLEWEPRRRHVRQLIHRHARHPDGSLVGPAGANAAARPGWWVLRAHHTRKIRRLR